MKLVELTEFLVRSLANNPDMVSVKALDVDSEELIIEVLVSTDDMGVVIGNSGKTANAIRTIVQAAAYSGLKKQVKININAF